jgi:hypothetical protein
MERLPKVVVVLARCTKQSSEFGVRLEEAPHRMWVADWAFAIKARVAQRERYDRAERKGSFSFAASYPGCPHCHSISAYKCSCGRLGCWDGEGRTVQCPWCGHKGEVGGSVDSLTSSGDR